MNKIWLKTTNLGESRQRKKSFMYLLLYTEMQQCVISAAMIGSLLVLFMLMTFNSKYFSFDHPVLKDIMYYIAYS